MRITLYKNPSGETVDVVVAMLPRTREVVELSQVTDGTFPDWWEVERIFHTIGSEPECQRIVLQIAKVPALLRPLGKVVG